MQEKDKKGSRNGNEAQEQGAKQTGMYWTVRKKWPTEDKQHDAFLATDCIGTEKLVSGTYNDDVFAFGDSGVRKLLADIQIEEQNHAEMLYKYKTVNGMM